MYAVGMIIIQAMNGAGDTYTPSALNFVCFWVLQIPLAYWLAEPMRFGPTGVFTSLITAESVLTILGVLIFRRGKWKTRIV
jgi:Na+-driven multidrug efflux pump